MRQRKERVFLDRDRGRARSSFGKKAPRTADTQAAMIETGITGFRYIDVGGPGAGSWVIEDNGRRLSAQDRAKLYREMGKTPVFGTSMLIFRLLLSQIDFKIQPRENSDDPLRVELAEFAEECLQDMAVGFEAGAWEQWSCLQYGAAECEIVFKERKGANPGTYIDRKGIKRDKPVSAFNDGKIGLDRLAYRAPGTIDRYILNANGGVEGIIQMDPNTGELLKPIPRWKLARFVFGATGSPHGDSMFDACLSVYPLWKRIHEAEAVGATRRLQGTPIAYAPQAWMTEDAPPDKKRAVDAVDETLRTLAATHDARLVVPSVYDEHGNQLLKVDLLSLSGDAGIDTNAILTRIELRMSSALLVSLMLLGQGSGGTQSLAKEQNKLLLDCLNALGHFRARAITDVLRTLTRLNGWPESEAPEYVAQSLKSIPDFAELCQGIAQVVPAGFMQGPDSVLSAELRARAGVAPPAEGEGVDNAPLPLEQIPPDGGGDPNNPDDPNNDPNADNPPPQPTGKPKPAAKPPSKTPPPAAKE
jgi:hypothetical protein